jgi:hypothetical protein
MEAVVLFEPEQVEDRLHDLGLNAGSLVAAVTQGLYAYMSSSPLHPVSHAGYSAWAETVATLREVLGELGWRLLYDAGLDLVANRDDSMRIVVRSGNPSTGRPDEVPQPKSDNGPKTIAFVEANLKQAKLFDLKSTIAKPVRLLGSVNPATTNPSNTWILLIYRDMKLKEVRAELSRPVSIDTENNVELWVERIILAPIRIDGDDIAVESIDQPDVLPASDIDVEVSRRA